MSTEARHTPKVSVLIPVYNGAPFLAEAIESVQAQTLGDFELIVADDGSTDGSQDVVRKFAGKDNRIVFTQNERNLGCVKNINRLALSAKGEYLKYLIQDDVLAPDCLELCARVLDVHPKVALVTSFQKFIGDRQDVRKLPTLPAIGELDGRLVQRHVLKFGNWIGGETAVMLRRESLVAGLFNPDWVWQVDQDMWLRILADCNLYVVPKILTYPRVHPGQNTVKLDKGFTFIREELMQLNVAFMFPAIYGAYSKQEQRRLREPILSRLIQHGFDASDPALRKDMISIGGALAGSVFRLLLVRFYWKRIVARAFLVSGMSRLYNSVRRRGGNFARNFIWGRKFNFRFGHALVDVGYGSVPTIGEMFIPISMLRSPIMTPTGFEVVMLDETPHYKWIKDLVEGNDDSQSRERYRLYLGLYHLEDDADATMRKVVELVESIRVEFACGREPTIVTHPPSDYGGSLSAVIYDGNHRAGIAKAMGRPHIRCRIVEIEMTRNYFPPRFFDARLRERAEALISAAN